LFATSRCMTCKWISGVLQRERITHTAVPWTYILATEGPWKGSAVPELAVVPVESFMYMFGSSLLVYMFPGRKVKGDRVEITV